MHKASSQNDPVKNHRVTFINNALHERVFTADYLYMVLYQLHTPTGNGE
jgi:hypothetical protein